MLTLSIRACRFCSLIWVEHFEYRMKSLPDWIVDTVDTCMQILLSDLSRTFRTLSIQLIRDWCCTIEDRGLMWTLSIQRSKHAMHLMLCLSILSILLKTESKERAYVNTVDTNKIRYSIHNSIALIFCIDCLDMSFNVHTTDKVTVSGFLTI